MTFGKAAWLTVSFVAALALGILTGPTIRDSWQKMQAPEQSAAAQPAEDREAAAPAERAPARARTSSPRAARVSAPARPSNAITTVAAHLWEPELRDRAKAILNQGARLELASAGFETPEQFMTVAHAARNTEVPFMVLKDRVLYQDQSLAAAIREFRPELDVKAEVTRARAEALSDLEIEG